MNRTNSRHRGRRDQKARAALAPLVAAGLAVCWRCGDPIDPDEPWDAGHVIALVDGGSPTGERRPEHRSCNRSDGARRARAADRALGRSSRAADWLARTRFFCRPPTSWATPAALFSPPIPNLSTPTTPEIFLSTPTLTEGPRS